MGKRVRVTGALLLCAGYAALGKWAYVWGDLAAILVSVMPLTEEQRDRASVNPWAGLRIVADVWQARSMGTDIIESLSLEDELCDG